ncbi:HAMP domain-containing protein [Streptomyces sp. NPDC059863]|uniref:HAMP domain-containing protein n=1 Tax=unclassified Streptomyces TaxID=2593676 RepID=UPI00365234F7
MNSERTRLTALYTGLLMLAGVLLTGLVYLLLKQSLESQIGRAVAGVSLTLQPGADAAERAAPVTTVGSLAEDESRVAETVSHVAGDAALSRLLTVSGLSLVAFAVVSAALARWMAGRVLHPVGVITARARRLSEANLHERPALRSPPGELKELADTFDQMLDRIEHHPGHGGGAAVRRG